MKIFRIALLLLCLAVSWSRADVWQNRKISIGAAPALTLTAANAEIVVGAEAAPATRFAAAELQTFLQQIFGSPIPLNATPSTGKLALIVGLNDWTAKAGVDPAVFARDAFILKTSGTQIFLGGRDDPREDPVRAIARGGAWSHLYERASLFAVYDFLERFAGVRMYFPGELGTVVPRADQLAIPELDIYDRPDFSVREYSIFWDGEYFEGENADATIHPQKNLNSYRLRMQTQFIPNCHGLNSFNYIGRFGESHPEYFALMDNGLRYNNPEQVHPGQLCYSSGIREEIYQDIKAYLQGRPASERNAFNKKGEMAWPFSSCRYPYVDVMPQDSFYPCQCEPCKKAYIDDKHYATELMWNLVTEWGNRLKRENVPGIITMMAYTPYRRVPTATIPDNVIVRVAEHGPWGETNPAQQQADNDEIKAWVTKLGRKVWLWNYKNKFGARRMPGIPAPTPRAVATYYQSLAPYIFGAFMESESDRFLYFYLNYYVYSRVAWNTGANAAAILDEHYRLMFGPAAPVMQKLFERYEDIWLRQIGGRVVDTPLGPTGAPPSDYELWTSVYAPAVLAEISAVYEEADRLAAADPLIRRRIALFRREYHETVLKASEQYRQMTAAVQGLQLKIQDKPGRALFLSPFDAKKEGGTTVQTQVWSWLTATHLHVRFDCQEPAMEARVAKQRPLDDPDIWRDNCVEIFLNPAADHKVYFQLLINSAGSLSDQRCTKIGVNAQSDWSWNSQAEVNISASEQGWQADVAIPLTSMPPLQPRVPANFTRNRVLNAGKGFVPLYQWGTFARGFHDLENYGSLVPAPDRCILINPDFSIAARYSPRHFGLYNDKREWLGGWIGTQSQDDSKAEIDTTVYFSAPSSLKLSGPDGVGATQYLPTLKPNTRYRLTFMLRMRDVERLRPNASGVCANLWDDANRWFPAHNWLTGSCEWIRQSFEITTGKNTNANGNPYLQLRKMSASGTAWFDDITLEEIGPE